MSLGLAGFTLAVVAGLLLLLLPSASPTIPVGMTGPSTTLKGASVYTHLFIPVSIKHEVNIFCLSNKWNKDRKTGVADREGWKQEEMSI